MPVSDVVPVPPLAAAEKAIGENAENWKARCYEIACKFVSRGLVEGVAVYGHWLGPVHEDSLFYPKSSAGFVQHGWVLLPDERIIDPTRWCFEAVKPYIFGGKNNGEYDEGGNQWRTKQRGRIPPDYDPDSQHFDVSASVMNTQTWRFVEKLLMLEAHEQEPGQLTFEQLLWLAHTAPGELGAHAPFVYEALRKLGHGAMIPYDNQRMVERLYPKKENTNERR